MLVAVTVVSLCFTCFVFNNVAASDDDQKPRTCIDLENGICELDGLYSYCYINLKTGIYNCDDQKKCAQKSDQFRGKKEKGGCFGNGDCCCKSDNPICNYVFAKQFNVSQTQTCKKRHVSGSGSAEPANCTDHYCYTVRYTVPGKTGAYKSGCHSMLRYYLQYTTDDSIHHQMDAMTKKTCAEIFRDKAAEDGVEEDQITQACQQIETTDALGDTVTGKFCCCTSGELCNEELWPMKKGADDLDFIPGVGTGGVSRQTAGYGVFMALVLWLLLTFRL